MMNWIYLLLIPLYVASCSEEEQPGPDVEPPHVFQLTVQPNVEVDRANDDYVPEEPCIWINPNNPDNIVIGANIDNMYTSFDGGLTWPHQTMDSPLGVFGDPVIINDKEGNFLYFHLSDVPHMQWDNDSVLDRMVCQRSTDGGKTWSDGVSIGHNGPRPDQDKEWAVLDPTNGNVYLTWTEFGKYLSREPGDSTNIHFAVSEDNGLTWSDPLRINQYAGYCIDSDSAVEGAVPAAMKDGVIGVSWSFDNKIWFDRSEDGGKTWLEKDIIVCDQPGGWNYDIPGISRCNGLPVLKYDFNSDNLYVNWTDTRNGEDNADVWIAKSEDMGTTWSSPKRVNADTTERHQFFSWMDIDPATGFIYIVYYDRAAYNDDQTDVTLSWSQNEGETFEHIVISETPFLPYQSVFFGDYTNIIVRNGQVRPVWTRMDTGSTALITTLIEVK